MEQNNNPSTQDIQRHVNSYFCHSRFLLEKNPLEKDVAYILPVVLQMCGSDAKRPFPSDSSTAHADPECLDESDKVCAQLLSFPSTKHFFFPAMPQKDWETWYFDQIFRLFRYFVLDSRRPSWLPPSPRQVHVRWRWRPWKLWRNYC